MALVKIHALGVLMLGVLAQGALAGPLVQSAPVDAFINLGAGPYPEASSITTGNAQPWYDSSQIARFFGGQPTAAQQAAFDSTVVQRVEQTFSASGVPVSLTDDPTVAAAHTLSLVSNTASATLPSAIGMTELGSSGFSFIDQIAPVAQSLDQLEWIIAHNISHELMIAFGVGENYDHTGNYIDAPLANWAMITSPTATFSPAAAAALNAAGLANPAAISFAPIASTSTVTGTSTSTDAQSVPEPATSALWLLAVGTIVVARRGSTRRGDA